MGRKRKKKSSLLRLLRSHRQFTSVDSSAPRQSTPLTEDNPYKQPTTSSRHRRTKDTILSVLRGQRSSPRLNKSLKCEQDYDEDEEEARTTRLIPPKPTSKKTSKFGKKELSHQKHSTCKVEKTVINPSSVKHTRSKDKALGVRKEQVETRKSPRHLKKQLGNFLKQGTDHDNGLVKKWGPRLDSPKTKSTAKRMAQWQRLVNPWKTEDIDEESTSEEETYTPKPRGTRTSWWSDDTCTGQGLSAWSAQARKRRLEEVLEERGSDMLNGLVDIIDPAGSPRTGTQMSTKKRVKRLIEKHGSGIVKDLACINKSESRPESALVPYTTTPRIQTDNSTRIRFVSASRRRKNAEDYYSLTLLSTILLQSQLHILRANHAYC